MSRITQHAPMRRGARHRLVVDRSYRTGATRTFWGGLRIERGAEERIALANRERWLDISRRTTVGDATTRVTDLRDAWGRSFRLVDGHGRQYGLRYTCQETRNSLDWNAPEHLVTDSRGRQHWMSIRQRVRIVDAQPEDLNSQLSRMLKAAHKRSLE